MKKILLPLLIAFVVLVGFKTQTKNKVVFFGDSITQAGVGPKGYISLIGETLKQKGLQDQFELIGAGVSGNKVTNLFLRLESDVLKKNPTTVVIWIGVNDVWHKKGGTGTDAYTFEKFYELIIQKLQETQIKVVICTPAVIGEKTDSSNGQDKDLDQYAGIIRKLATQYNCELVDLRKSFTEYDSLNNSENKSTGILTADGVHLNDAGNQFVAEEMIKVLVKE